MVMEYTTAQLKTALIKEYEWMSHDTDVDYTMEEYITLLDTMTYSQLIDETCTDDTYYTLQEYMDHWG